MTDIATAILTAVVAAQLDASDLVAIVASTADGPAVFAPRQPFADRFPRNIVDTPQILPRPSGCGTGSEVWIDVHSYARGPDASLVAGQLAAQTRLVLDVRLQLTGHRVIAGDNFRGSHAIGDPDPTVEHVVSRFRYLTEPA